MVDTTLKSLFRSYDTHISHAHIITVKGHTASEQYALRCAQSCDQVGQPWRTWYAYDGTQEGEIKPPNHMINCSFMRMIKIMDNYLTKAEVACALSHISLWAHCVITDKPVIVLEHDAIMLKPMREFPGHNTIVYLGGSEWAELKWPIMHVPLHGSDGPNKHFICRAHAYAIEPVVAKNMLAHVLKMGIYASLDEMISADLYNISHVGCVAYDKQSETTIRNRPKDGRHTLKNDQLLW